MPALDDILGPGKSLNEYFKRYDFDENGTLSSVEEAQQLTLNLIFAIEKAGRRDELLEERRNIPQATALVNEQNWEPDSQPPKDEKWYGEWFEKTFLKHPEPSSELLTQTTHATVAASAGAGVVNIDACRDVIEDFVGGNAHDSLDDSAVPEEAEEEAQSGFEQVLDYIADEVSAE